MLRTHIDFATAVRILVSIVKDFGVEHAAPSGDAGCTYFLQDVSETSWGGTSRSIDTFNLRPVCIVGHAFHRLGIMRALLSGSSDQYSTCQPDSLLWSNAEAMGVEFSEDAKRLFRAAQQKQDGGNTWRDSVESAVAEVREYLVSEFKADHPAFGYDANSAVLDLPDAEPLADWEKELLNG